MYEGVVNLKKPLVINYTRIRIVRFFFNNLLNFDKKKILLFICTMLKL